MFANPTFFSLNPALTFSERLYPSPTNRTSTKIPILSVLPYNL